jgi:hypothetical protein
MNGIRSPYQSFIAAAAVLIPLLSGCTSSQADLYKTSETPLYKDERVFTELALSALSTARPDYGFDPAPTSVRSADGLSVTLTAYPIGTSMADVGEIPVSVTFDQASGATRVSPLPKTRLGSVLMLTGASKEGVEVKQDARELLSNMGRSIGVVAVAELAEPMTESAALSGKSGLSQPQRVLLSPGAGEMPLGNSLYCGRRCAEQS